MSDRPTREQVQTWAHVVKHADAVLAKTVTEQLCNAYLALLDEHERLKAFEARVRDVVACAAPRPPGGQQVGVQRYQMTPSTLKEFHRIIRDCGLTHSPKETP